MTKKYYLCEIKQEEVMAEFYDESDAHKAAESMRVWDDRHEIEEGMTSYAVVVATSPEQAEDMMKILSHAQNCKYAAFLMEAKRLDEDDSVHIADKWFHLMRVMNASRFWQQD